MIMSVEFKKWGRYDIDKNIDFKLTISKAYKSDKELTALFIP